MNNKDEIITPIMHVDQIETWRRTILKELSKLRATNLDTTQTELTDLLGIYLIGIGTQTKLLKEKLGISKSNT